eukprot:Em0015g931a
MFPDSMKAFHTPNLDILGAPIGDYIHCAKFIASKRVEALKLLSRLQDVAVIDPQVAFTLLHVCGSFCRLAHIARSTPPSLSSDPLQIVDMAVKECFATCSALDLTEHAWQQAQLGLRYGGLGLRSLALHACAAYIASISSLGFADVDNQHLKHAVSTFNGLVSTQDTILIGSTVDSPIPQKALSFKIDTEQFRALLDSSSPANKARLLSASASHASSWLSVVPSVELGLHLDPHEFCAHLGVHVEVGSNLTPDGSRSRPADVLVRDWITGRFAAFDFTVSSPLSVASLNQACITSGFAALSAETRKHKANDPKCSELGGGDVVSRHNKLRDILAESCRRAHLGVQVEMGNNLTNHSHTRPADLLVPNWVLGKPAAFDLSVTSPLNPTTLLEASVTTGVAALTTELRKHSSNDTKCKELDWVYVPLVVESYGAWGKEALESISQLASRLATCSSKAKSVVLTELYGRLNLHLVRANAIAILACSLGQSDVGRYS